MPGMEYVATREAIRSSSPDWERSELAQAWAQAAATGSPGRRGSRAAWQNFYELPGLLPLHPAPHRPNPPAADPHPPQPPG